MIGARYTATEILAALLATSVLASGCSGEAGRGRGDEARQTAATGTISSESADDTQDAASAKLSAVTGQVSALTADVSDLNVRVTDLGTIIDLPSDALFEFDKATLTPNAEAELRKASALIVRAPAGTIRIIGHTDSKGDDAYNQRLSQARAQTVADWFSQQVGVRQRAFSVSGVGATAPIAPNETATGGDDPAGRAKNRRVEVVLPQA